MRIHELDVREEEATLRRIHLGFGKTTLYNRDLDGIFVGEALSNIEIARPVRFFHRLGIIGKLAQRLFLTCVVGPTVRHLHFEPAWSSGRLSGERQAGLCP